MRNHFRTWILFGVLSAIFIGMGSILSRPYMVTFALIALTMNVCAYGFSDRLMLAVRHAREIAPT